MNCCVKFNLFFLKYASNLIFIYRFAEIKKGNIKNTVIVLDFVDLWGIVC